MIEFNVTVPINAPKIEMLQYHNQPLMECILAAKNISPLEIKIVNQCSVNNCKSFQVVVSLELV